MWLTIITHKKPFIGRMSKNQTNGSKMDQGLTNGNMYTTKAPEDDESHQMISSLFLGPHAENYEYFKSNIITILEYTRDARLNYFPEDGVSILGLCLYNCSNSTLHCCHDDHIVMQDSICVFRMLKFLPTCSASSARKCRLRRRSRKAQTRLATLSKRPPNCSANIRSHGGRLVMRLTCVWT